MSITTESSDYVQCRWCGNDSPGECSLVKSKEAYPDGTLKRVEFHGHPLDQGTENKRTTDDYNWLFGTGRFAQ